MIGIIKSTEWDNADNIKKYERILSFNKIQYKTFSLSEIGNIDILKDLEYLIYRRLELDDHEQIYNIIIPIIDNYYGIKCLPDNNTSWHYDDKIKQYYLLKMCKFPVIKSWIFWDKNEAISFLKTTNYPIVLKLKGGSGSRNVTILNSFSEAKKIVNRLFNKGINSRGIPGRNSLQNSSIKSFLKDRLYPTYAKITGRKWDLFWKKNKNYVLFQFFLPNNNFDTRVTVIGDRAFAFRRYVRKNDFRASGSGNVDYTASLINLDCISIAFEVSNKFGFQTMAYDFLFNEEGKPEICEMSYTYIDAPIYQCPGYWDSNLKWQQGSFWPQYCQLVDLLSNDNLIQPDLK